MSSTYIPLEPSYFSSTGVTAPTFDATQATSLFTSTSFLYSLGIMICVVAAGIMYAKAGLWRMEASHAGITKSNEIFRRTTFGLLLILSMFTLVYTINPDLLTGDVSLQNFKVNTFKSGGGGDFAGGGATGGWETASASCTTKEAAISALTSSAGICGNAQCTKLSGCQYQQYLPIIQSEASKAGVNPNVLIALMCRESGGKKDAEHLNSTDGTYDCGLMQVNNGKNKCDATIMDPATNITRGALLIKEKMGIANQVYQNIPTRLGSFASYNCCANGTIPNEPSADCTQASGFPYSIPKWACPINPGAGNYNMCFVKGYACEVEACVRQLEGL